MKYCPFCGSGLQDTMVFCPKCGKRFLVGFENPEAIEPERIKLHHIDPTEPAPTSVVVLESEPVAEEESVMVIESEPAVAEELVAEPEGAAVVETAKQPAKKKTKKIVWLVVAVLLVALGAGGFFGIRKAMKSASITDMANAVLYLEICDDTDSVIGTASGFIIEDGTTLVTNYHVIDGAHHIIAYTPDGESSVEIHTVLAYDEEADLAVLKCEDNIGVPPLLLGDSDAVKQGDEVFAVGYPLGVANTLSDGVVSSRYLDEYDTDILQITAAISSGSSGGALFNKAGQVIGVICASYIDGQNLNVAISSNTLADLLEEKAPTDLEEFFTPTYSVGYVIENHEKLLNKEFYVLGWVTSHGYIDYEDSDLLVAWAYIYDSPEDIPDGNWRRDGVYESEHYRDRFIQVECDDWAGSCEALELVEEGDCLLVKGQITLKWSEFDDGVVVIGNEFLIID